MAKKSILYIEDNFHNRRIVRKILEKKDYVINEAEDGLAGFQMLQRQKPLLVLLDISLPGMDGIEIAQRVKASEELKDTFLIALTASAMAGDKERFLEAGCDDYLSKPFKAAELVDLVEGHYERLLKKRGLPPMSASISSASIFGGGSKSAAPTRPAAPMEPAKTSADKEEIKEIPAEKKPVSPPTFGAPSPAKPSAAPRPEPPMTPPSERKPVSPPSFGVPSPFKSDPAPKPERPMTPPSERKPVSQP
ncbi:MAG: response regulator, partial [Anaerolineae bacterium]|nr:response regulator [Anaerolineae bacterium]